MITEAPTLPKLNPKYLVFGGDSRYYFVTGGRGSGKSYAVALILLALTYETGHKILFARWTMLSAYRSIIPEFLQKIELLNAHADFEVTKTEIINKTTGSSILFSGIKTSSGLQTANLKSLEGITTFVLDEGEELHDEETFDKIDLSVRTVGADNRVIVLMNPATKEHIFYNKFFTDRGVEAGFNGTKGDTTYIHTTYLDNIENLADSYIRQLERMKIRRPEKYNHQILGGWLNKAQGVIFDQWKLGEYQKLQIEIYGQDFGYSVDPTTLIKVSIDTTRKVMYVKELLHKAGLVTSEIARANNVLAGNGLIIADSADPRLIDELASAGNNIQGASKKEIYFGIQMIRDYDVIVDPDSTNLIKELNNYTWVEKKSQQPCDAWNHLIDAWRYAVVYTLSYRGDYYI